MTNDQIEDIVQKRLSVGPLFEIRFKRQEHRLNVILNYLKQIRDHLRLHERLAQTEITYIERLRHSLLCVLCGKTKRKPQSTLRQ